MLRITTQLGLSFLLLFLVLFSIEMRGRGADGSHLQKCWFSFRIHSTSKRCQKRDFGPFNRSNIFSVRPECFPYIIFRAKFPIFVYRKVGVTIRQFWRWCRLACSKRWWTFQFCNFCQVELVSASDLRNWNEVSTSSHQSSLFKNLEKQFGCRARHSRFIGYNITAFCPPKFNIISTLLL